MKTRIKRILATCLSVSLCLSAIQFPFTQNTTKQAVAQKTSVETLKLTSKKAFRAIRKGTRYTIKLKGKTIKKCKSSKKSVVSVKGKNTIQAVKPGKAVITIIDRNKKSYKLSLWVRPATSLNKETQTVTMIGNSHFRTGGQPGYLKGIAALYGQPIKILNESIDGYMLEEHLQNAQKGKRIAKSLKNADMVVFQEYGTRYETTLDSILAMKKYCKKSAKLYYYATDYDIYCDWNARRAELKKQGITVIASGTLLSKLYKMGFTYEDLHDANDDHPNCINGYLSSMLMYAQIFHEKCSDFPTKQYLDYFEEIVPGKNKTQKWKKFKQICKTADKLVTK